MKVVAGPDFALLLIQLTLLLLVARALGEFLRARGQPPVVGELMAGVVIGPTIVGGLFPTAFATLFPPLPAQWVMLDTITRLGGVLLLLLAGLEIDLSVLRHQRNAALLTSGMGIAIPFAAGAILAGALPQEYLVPSASREAFIVFMGVALSISAIPVIARILIDLGILQTQVGQVVMSAAILDDIVGWFAFSVLVHPIGGIAVLGGDLAARIACLVVFCVVCFTVGALIVRSLLALSLRWMPGSGGVLTVSLIVAMVCAAITEMIGVHAVFGAFVAGLMIGSCPTHRDAARRSVSDFVLYFFSPLFFGVVGLQINIVEHFDLALVALLLTVACGTKIIGCGLGARWAGLGRRESLAVGFGMNARGAMGIILATLALKAGLIRESVFTALVIVAVVTSLIAGPLIKRTLAQPESAG